MSQPLGELDRVLGTVQRRKAGIMLQGRRHGPIAQNHPVSLLVVTEQAGREVVAPAVPLAAPGVDPHSHWDIPFFLRSAGSSSSLIHAAGLSAKWA
jgi:hypothetical protein